MPLLDSRSNHRVYCLVNKFSKSLDALSVETFAYETDLLQYTG